MSATDLSSLHAAILAGGLGTRLRSVVADRPKVLAEVHGRPFVARILDQLAGAGLREVVLCTGHMADAVATALGDRHGPLRLRVSPEPEPLGTGGALRLAAPMLGSDPVLVLNGDSFCEVDLRALLDEHRTRGAAATLTLVEVPDTRRFGRVELDEGGAVRRFEEKAAAAGAGWINAGVYLLGRGVLGSIPDGSASLENDVLPAWVGRGLFGHRARGRFLDIGTPESYREAERFFAPATGGARP